MKRALMIVLVAVMLAGCLAPMAMAETPEGSPSREDMRGHGDIAVPKNDSWLPAYETRYVCSSGGVAAFLFKAPKPDMDLHFDDVLEGTELTVLAEENGFYLVKMAGNRLGWIGVGQTAEDTALLDSVPDLKEGVWVLSMGEGEKNTYAVQFGEGRIATLARSSDGAKLRSGWILSGRRVWVNEKYFIWDGESFVSRDEYQTAAGKIRYTLSFDADGKYNDLF